MMPVVDGAGFVRAYRDGPGPHAPVIVLSASDEALAAAQAASIGAAAYLAKPYDLDNLVGLVTGAVRDARCGSGSAN
jgi:CheY-like chemotaxis protein